MLPPAEGSWSTVSWSILGGSFVDEYGNPISGPAVGESVRFIANSSDPVTLFATAAHSSGCTTPEGTVQVPIRTIPAVQISAPPEACPYAPATASVLPPAEGSWGTRWVDDSQRVVRR